MTSGARQHEQEQRPGAAALRGRHQPVRRRRQHRQLRLPDRRARRDRHRQVSDGADQWAAGRVAGLHRVLQPDRRAAHPTLSALPTTDQHLLYCTGTAQDSPAAGLLARQIGYDGKRGNDGALTFTVTSQASTGVGLEWGRLLTAGEDASTNLLVGAAGTFEGGIANWVLNGNCTIAASSAQAHAGTGSLAITATGTSDATAKHVSSTTGGFAVTPGRQYLVQGWFRAATAARSVRLQVDWFTSGGATVSSSAGTNVTDSTSAWTFASLAAVAPATAAFGTVIARVITPGGAREVHYVDDVQFVAMPAGVSSTTGAATTFGVSAYLQVTAFTGTDATITLHSSSDDGATDAYSAITGGAFTSGDGGRARSACRPRCSPWSSTCARSSPPPADSPPCPTW
jgi:hypothetical protein